jgi:PKD repeat protein
MKKITFLVLVLLFSGLKIVLPQDTLILQPGPEGKDAQIHTILPDNNYENTVVFKCMAWTHSGVPGTNRALIAFDLSSLPPQTTILEARLNLYFATYEPTYVTHTGENASYLLRIIEPWEENTVTWNNQPETTMEDAVILPQSTDPEQDYTDINVKDLVQLMVSDPEHNYGLKLRLITEEFYRCLMFGSGDGENPLRRPKLEIIYVNCDLPTADFEYETHGDTANFAGISPGATSWYWDFGDGYFSDLSNPFHIYDESGEYQVCLVTSNDCGSYTVCKLVEVCRPVAAFTWEIINLDAFFTDESTFADEYYWDFGDGYYSNLSNPWHAYEEEGNYLVCLITSSECGSDTACEMIGMVKSSITESIQDVPEIYPNPASDMIFIKPLTEGEVMIRMSDLSGKEVLLENMSVATNETIKIPLDQIEPGLYILTFDSGADRSYAKLVVTK